MKKTNNTGLTLIEEAPLEEQQILQIMGKTPKKHIYSRPAKGGGEWEYVTGVYVKKVLNYVFGWLWDFEIVEHGRENDLVWVLGRLTVKGKDGVEIKKMQFGRADVKMKRGTKIPLDFGNDLKAASTDALKKCASELGVASDVYGRNEFREVEGPPRSADKETREKVDNMAKQVSKGKGIKMTPDEFADLPEGDKEVLQDANRKHKRDEYAKNKKQIKAKNDAEIEAGNI